jgi:peptidoglycan lytic transglycosylase
MVPPALSSQLNAVRLFFPASRVKAAVTSVLAITLLCGMTSFNAADAPDEDSDVVVPSFANAGSSAAGDSELVLLVEADRETGALENCQLGDTATFSALQPPVDAGNPTVFPIVLQPDHNVLNSTHGARDGTGQANLFSFVFRSASPEFSATYRAVRKFAAMLGLSRLQDERALVRPTFVGAVSTYNPYREGIEEGGPQTASGEFYDPAAWTAAIQSGLRDQFGGVRFGKLYQPAFALVTSGEKRLIVKINDVGPLRAGRVLDLNERSMRYFDPFLTRGLLQDTRITLLQGEDWTPGPVGDAYLIDFASVERQKPAVAANWSAETEIESLRAKLDRMPAPNLREEVRAEAKLATGD